MEKNIKTKHCLQDLIHHYNKLRSGVTHFKLTRILIYIGTAIVMGSLPSKWAEDNTFITLSSGKWAENSRKQEHWPKNIIHCMFETERNNYQ
jgi:hypothetical protein